MRTATESMEFSGAVWIDKSKTIVLSFVSRLHYKIQVFTSIVSDIAIAEICYGTSSTAIYNYHPDRLDVIICGEDSGAFRLCIHVISSHFALISG